MSQVADFNVANGAGAAVRADLNNILAALASLSAGSSPPTSTHAYMVWYDTAAEFVSAPIQLSELNVP